MQRMIVDSAIATVATSGAFGLGAATACSHAACGTKVAIFDRNAEPGAALAAEIDGMFGEVSIVSEKSANAAFAKVPAAHGQEHVLVYSAEIGRAIKTVGHGRKTGENTQLALSMIENGCFDGENVRLDGTVRMEPR